MWYFGFRFGFEALEFPLMIEQGGSNFIQTEGLGLVDEMLRRVAEALWGLHADALLFELRDPQSRVPFVVMVVFLPLTLVATHQLSRARTSKNLPFDLFDLIFGDLDAFVDVVRVKVECEEEREKRG